MSLKFHITTFGCQMNKHDSERLAGVLAEQGYAEAASVEDADLLVFNTCTVRKHAAERLYGRVSELRRLKEERPGLLVAVGGCLAQEEGENLRKRLPHVDVVFGTHNLHELPSLLDAVLTGRRPVVETPEAHEMFASDLPSRRKKPFAAWLSISVGCSNRCSYCVVPYVRGPERSRPIGDVLKEAAELADDGVIEVTLLGQNVNSYGVDLYGKTKFPELLREIDRLGFRRVRFATSHPKDLSDETIDAMAELPSICEHLHLPVQAGSDRILEFMERRYTGNHYLELVEKARRKVDGLSVTTDIMVGFPGETERDFEDTLEIVRRARFEGAFTFIYSPRANTKAAGMDNQVPEEIKKERLARLIEELNTIALQKNELLKGTVQEVLVEKKAKRGDGLLAGKTRSNKTVNFQGSASLLGKIVQVRIEEAHTFSLRGRLVDT